MLLKKLSIALVVSLSFCFSTFHVYAAELLLGGDSIGIDLSYDGILITGTYDIEIEGKSYNPSSNGFCEGDLITHVNGQKVETIGELMKEIEKRISVSQKIMLTFKHDQQTKTQELYLQNKDNQFSTGLYVIDGISGIGTMTYYNPSTHHFAALGHMMSDPSLSIDLEDVKGAIYQSKVTSIVKSQSRKPGEKIAEISHIKIGDVQQNNQYGLYGQYDQAKMSGHTVIETADIDEIKTGKAYFYTVLNGNKVEKCEINITHLKKQSTKDVKGITFEVTDQNVIEKCNGIVQGMSGSPIVQDGKLIGCVTHVDMNDTHKGYGLYINWMLENDK